MRNINTAVLSLSAALLCSCTLGGGPDLTPKKSSEIDPSEITAKVLFVGNSFTYYNDMPQLAVQIGVSLGMNLTAGQVTKGSQKLIDTADSNNELGAQFDAALDTPYTHVILQEHSTTPLNNFNNFLAGVRACKAKINAKLPNAKIYLYATWAYEAMCNQGETIPQCEARIRQAYEDCANQTGLTVLHVGKAFSYAYAHQASINLYDANDNKHPSYAGSYLAAATHLGSIFGVDVRPTTVKGDLSDADSAALLKVAYDVANRLI